MAAKVPEIPIEDLAFQSSPAFAADVEKYKLDLQAVKSLAESAVKVKCRAHCPYSNFRVGAALLTKDSIPATHVAGSPLSSSDPATSSGLTFGAAGRLPSPQIVVGVNVENASYPVGTCAERCALGTAVALGHGAGSFQALAVATDISPPASPCGMCRQFIREFCQLDMPIFMIDGKGESLVRTVEELLPLSFGPEHLGA